MEYIASILAVCGTIITIFQWYTAKMSLRAKFISTHTDINNRIREIQMKLPTNINDDEFNPTPEEEQSIIRLTEIYWYFVFDEFFICEKMNSSFFTKRDFFYKLWKNYYRIGAKSALKRKYFKSSLEKLMKVSSTFNSNQKFIQEMEILIQEHENK